MIEHLKQAGISTGIHYPIPLHLQKAYAHMGYGKGSFPVTEKAAAEILSLPMFPQLTSGQQARVAREIHAFFAPGDMCDQLDFAAVGRSAVKV
jgi:dTDP-4-amino-4,6-dideoxygalactose transaminase